MIPQQIKKNKGAQSALISDIVTNKKAENMVATPIVEEHYKGNIAMEPMSSYSTTTTSAATKGRQGSTEGTKGTEGTEQTQKRDIKSEIAYLTAEIKEAKKEMEQAAKALNFTAAASHRDHMYELEALLKSLDKYSS
jgi:excinuclease UvrABC helicase subunit UvrB